MPNFVKHLKEEITRLARKEIKVVVSRFRKDSSRVRRVVSELKRRLAALEKENRQLARNAARPADVPAKEKGPRARFTAKGMRSLRRRLGLTAAQLGKLLGTTAQTVYNWEHKQGALRLRTVTREGILQIRDLRAREAREALHALTPARPASRKRRSKGRRRR
jgi:DNA-binding transcriptional regulator YiaG